MAPVFAAITHLVSRVIICGGIIRLWFVRPHALHPHMPIDRDREKKGTFSVHRGPPPPHSSCVWCFFFVFFPQGERLQDAAPGLEFLLRAVLTGSTNPARPRPPRASPPCPWVTSPRGRAGRSSSRPACSPSVSPRLTRSWHRCPDRHGATVTPKRAAGVSGPCLCNADHLLL